MSNYSKVPTKDFKQHYVVVTPKGVLQTSEPTTVEDAVSVHGPYNEFEIHGELFFRGLEFIWKD